MDRELAGGRGSRMLRLLTIVGDRRRGRLFGRRVDDVQAGNDGVRLAETTDEWRSSTATMTERRFGMWRRQAGGSDCLVDRMIVRRQSLG